MSKSTNKDDNIHAGHRARMRARFMASDPTTFEPHEYLELLLTYVIARKNVNPLAHILVREFGSLKNVLDASPQDLMRIKGVGPKTASYLKLISKVPACLDAYARHTQRVQIVHSLDASKLHRKYLEKADPRHTCVLYLNENHILLYAGVLTEEEFHSPQDAVRKIARVCMRTGASAVNLGTPAGSDWLKTLLDHKMELLYIRDYLSLFDVELLDYLVVTEGSYYSIFANKVQKSMQAAMLAQAQGAL